MGLLLLIGIALPVSNAQTPPPTPTRHIDQLVTDMFGTYFPGGTPFQTCVTATPVPQATTTFQFQETLVPNKPPSSDWIAECGQYMPTSTPIVPIQTIPALDCGFTQPTQPSFYGSPTPTNTPTATATGSATPTLTPPPVAMAWYPIEFQYDYNDFQGLTGENRTYSFDYVYTGTSEVQVNIRLDNTTSIQPTYLQREFINGGFAEMRQYITVEISGIPYKMYFGEIEATSQTMPQSWAHGYSVRGIDAVAGRLWRYQDYYGTVAYGNNVPANSTHNWAINAGICTATGFYLHECYLSEGDTSYEAAPFYWLQPVDEFEVYMYSNAKSGTSRTRFIEAEFLLYAYLPSPGATPTPTPTGSATPTPTITPTFNPGATQAINCEIPEYTEEPIVGGIGDEIVIIDEICYVIVPQIDFRALDFTLDLPDLIFLPDTIGLEDVYLFDAVIEEVHLCVTWIQFPALEIVGVPIPLDWVLLVAVGWFVLMLLRF